jgi:hypothetical protein
VAERPPVGVLVTNLFLRVPVDSAVRGVGAAPVGLASPAAVATSGCRVVVVDLDLLKSDPEPAVRSWIKAGIVVLGFGPHVDAALLASARHAGAVVLPRSAFLGRLPELLAAALSTAGIAPRPERQGGEREGGEHD